jgi:hypothetical protein
MSWPRDLREILVVGEDWFRNEPTQLILKSHRLMDCVKRALKRVKRMRRIQKKNKRYPSPFFATRDLLDFQ